MNQLNIDQDTPRLVVEFQYDDEGQEKFGWGIVGKIPVITLVGYLSRVQAEQSLRFVFAPHQTYEGVKINDLKALVVVWKDKKFDYSIDPCIPTESISGMLDAIKLALVTSQMKQQAQSQIFGLDGRPIRRR